MPVVVVKWCPRCCANRRLKKFGVHRGRTDGLQVWCKKCMKEHRDAKNEESRAKWENKSPYDGSE